MNIFRRFVEKQIFSSPIILIDIGLFVTAFLMFATDHIVLFFHIIFVLLSIGAFFWSFRAFAFRSLFWVAGPTGGVLLAVLRGQTQPEEMIEIPLLTIILVMVFIIASFRTKAQRELDHEHRGLKQALEEQQVLQEALLHQAFYDKLTGLPNRALLFDRLQHAFLEAVRHKQSLALLFVDLDGFKAVNDRFGHAVGDQLLVEVAKQLRLVARDEDTVARLGGDEFTIVVKNPLSLEIAAEVAERVLNRISEPYQISGIDINISASIGVSMRYPKGDQPEDLLREADDAMYHAKASGKSKVYVHTENRKNISNSLLNS